jgi:hypothetical protein
MLETIKGFMKKLYSVPLGWVIWLQVLMVINMIIPLFYIGRIEAQLSVIAFFAAFITGTMIYRAQGFTHLLGAMHLTWIPLLVFLFTRLKLYPAEDFFGVWLRVLISLDIISLILDVREVIRYVRGEREPYL